MYILAGLVLFVALVSIFGIRSKSDVNQNEPGKVATSTKVNSLFNATSTSSKNADVFNPEVPKDAVPSTPQTGGSAGKALTGGTGIFELSMTKDGFSPEIITVKNKSFIQLKVTAVDGDYDFSIPYLEMYLKLKKGETKPASLTTDTVGTFAIECRDVCPANGKIKGALIVTP